MFMADFRKYDVDALCAALRDYRSIWRNLHIDGFEPHQLPCHIGMQYQFFHYAEAPKREK